MTSLLDFTMLNYTNLKHKDKILSTNREGLILDCFSITPRLFHESWGESLRHALPSPLQFVSVV